MPDAATQPAPPHPAAAGRRWVDQYFLPRLAERMPGRAVAGLRVLQLEPDDNAEAMRLVELGADVTLAEFTGQDARLGALPVVRCERRGAIPLSDDSVDVIITGHLGRIARAAESPAFLAAETARVCRPGGGLLAGLTSGCPLDLNRDGPRSITIAHLAAAFGGVHLLPVRGHFGWTSGSAARKLVGALLDRYWDWIARPDRPRLYASALNPIMLVWAAKRQTKRAQT